MRSVLVLALLLGLSACSGGNGNFNAWVADAKREAAERGISQSVIDDAFAQVHAPSKKIIAQDRTQPENTNTFAHYRSNIVTARKIAAAKEQWEEHHELLERVEAAYGVPAPILLALWGIESNFGENQGTHNIINSLATLAYDGRRSAFFRKELFAALTILQEQHMQAVDLTGSWAGAMGQVQFMPSSYLAFATDFDNNGTKDIWNSEDDAIASMANYLHSKGWKMTGGWGIEVSNALLEYKDSEKTLTQWQQLGVKRADGSELAQSSQTAKLIVPDDDPTTAFLIYSNYAILMDWNRSIYFASSVGLLADAIGEQ